MMLSKAASELWVATATKPLGTAVVGVKVPRDAPLTDAAATSGHEAESGEPGRREHPAPREGPPSDRHAESLAGSVQPARNRVSRVLARRAVRSLCRDYSGSTTRFYVSSTYLLRTFGGLAPGLAFGRRLRPRDNAGDIGIFVRSERGPVGFPPLSLVAAFGFLLLALLAGDFFLTLFEGIRSRSHCRRLFCLSAAKKRGIRSARGRTGQGLTRMGAGQVNAR